MKPRALTPPLLAALADTPVVFLSGARQVGKSTLVRALAEEALPARYLPLDDATVISDSGLAAHLLGLSPEHLRTEPTPIGPLLETFVSTEIAKQLGWSTTRAHLHHLRTHRGREVDLILEDAQGRCVAIEVKASTSLSDRHLRGIRAFAELAGERFHRGLVIYGGSEVVPFAANIHAVPVGALWGWRP